MYPMYIRNIFAESQRDYLEGKVLDNKIEDFALAEERCRTVLRRTQRFKLQKLKTLFLFSICFFTLFI